jgi:hypothetical protein
MPDSVISQGDVAIKQWVEDHAPTGPPPTRRDLHPTEHKHEARLNVVNIVNCAYVIVSVLASDKVLPAKLLRIKQLINDLGGAWAVAKMFLNVKEVGRSNYYWGTGVKRPSRYSFGYQYYPVSLLSYILRYYGST